MLDAVLARMNAFGRIALCGMISGYDGQPIPLQQPQLILQSRLTIEGFIVSEHMEVWPEALKELGTLVATGKLKYRESVAAGHRSRRPRPSSACSRAGTSASSWSSWSEARDGRRRSPRARSSAPTCGRSAQRGAGSRQRVGAAHPERRPSSRR